jgi:hypothetical protein
MRFEVKEITIVEYKIYDNFYKKYLPADYGDTNDAVKYANKLNQTRPQTPIVPKKKERV